MVKYQNFLKYYDYIEVRLSYNWLRLSALVPLSTHALFHLKQSTNKWLRDAAYIIICSNNRPFLFYVYMEKVLIWFYHLQNAH